jgi:hypothetical protein
MDFKEGNSMLKRHTLFVTILVFLPLAVMLTGCGKYGKVVQGRVIAFDKTNKNVTIIINSSLDPKNPEYSHLPPLTFQLPDDPKEMGPEPKVGKRMGLDIEKKQITIYDPDQGRFVTIDYTPVEERKNISETDPLLFDPVTKVAKVFPVLDSQNKTITIYSKRQMVLVTFTVPDQYFAYPPDTWDSGDEVRIYYKEEGKARRLMNVSQTDIYKK